MIQQKLLIKPYTKYSFCTPFYYVKPVRRSITRVQYTSDVIEPSFTSYNNDLAIENIYSIPKKSHIHFVSEEAPPLVFTDQSEWFLNDFLKAIEENMIFSVKVVGSEGKLIVTAKDGKEGIVHVPKEQIQSVLDNIIDHGVVLKYKDDSESTNKMIQYVLLNTVFPIVILVVFFRMMSLLFNRGGGGQGGIFSFGQSKAKFQEIPETGVSFDDVAGCDGAKRDLQEIVEFLKKPEKFTKLGAKIPKGCLLIGPSGTGKTLLAKAVAGEAKVPFFSCSASEWIEMLVGTGASRVRSLFKDAAEKAPCIVFIDEIDAVGKARSGSSGLAGNDERDQTINQLLTEMDGFDGNKGIIVIAATNRPDILDNALTRPGRFDRKIVVERPDCVGRVAILKVHTKNKPLAENVSLESLAKITAGSSGADLENLANEAAILASRKDKDFIEMEDFEAALDKIMMGEERRSTVMSENQKRVISVHEAGHALVSLLVGDYDRLKKVTIIPRGMAGGVTVFEPNEERVDFSLYSKDYLMNQICVALGGRIAELIVFGDSKTTTGASSDLMQVMNIAKRMVKDFGFSETLGSVAWKSGSAFNEDGKGYSEQTAYQIDQEIRKIVSTAYDITLDILETNKDKLMLLADTLLEKETIQGEDVRKLLGIHM
jgi:cell division protease FtsH